MAKQTLSKKNTHIQHTNGKGVQQEQTEVFDDNLLPDASEIAALAVLDPTILEWLKSRAEKEQDFRHQAFNKRSDLIDRNVATENNINILGLCFAFLIIMGGMAFSTYLITLGQVLTGTIFSGLTIVYAAALFIKGRKTETAKQE
ncbi:hypothetical protein [Flavobacterium denitrificans]|uniref:hypothetical protein n=1 Tax=Flavobacterium denitrificans TaxID=281361 RepID=UPI0004071A91|nr:hypothetical protein [Flavobacterium denitrificans]